jgi:hypothetical protein
MRVAIVNRNHENYGERGDVTRKLGDESLEVKLDSGKTLILAAGKWREVEMGGWLAFLFSGISGP